MKDVIRKEGVYVLADSEDEKAVEEARASEAADFDLLLHGNPGIKELAGILRRSLIRLMALERE